MPERLSTFFEVHPGFETTAAVIHSGKEFAPSVVLFPDGRAVVTWLDQPFVGEEDSVDVKAAAFSSHDDARQFAKDHAAFHGSFVHPEELGHHNGTLTRLYEAPQVALPLQDIIEAVA